MTEPSGASQHDSHFVIDENSTEMAWLLVLDTIANTAMGGLFPERADLANIHAILDIACGPGGWVLEVARAYPEIQVTGVDVSEEMINYARAHVQARGLDNATFHVMNALQPLDFPDGSFDLVNARTLFGFMTPATWPSLLQECQRILRPGSVLRLTEIESPISNSPALEQLWGIFSRALQVTGRSFSPTGRHLGTTPLLGRLLRQAGYQNIQHMVHALDFAAGTNAFEDAYQCSMIACKLLEPFFVKSGVTTPEEFEQLYQQAMGEMLSDDFCALWFYVTFWGDKP